MKKIIYGVVALCLGASVSSCSSDYLNLTPENSTSPNTIFSTTETAQYAVNGLTRLMSMQYQGFNQWFNGEGTIKTLYGNFTGNDYHRLYNNSGMANIANLSNSQNPSSLYSIYPWFYYYRLISNANSIVMHIGEASGSEQDRAFIKAEALTFRAYSYSMLVQIYGKRWMDSNGGTSRGVVLRLDESKNDLPASTLGECYEQIYRDLDEAVALFKASGKDRPAGNNHLPNLNAAYAVYARAAVNREDWTTAAKYAALAREGYPLMTNAEYKEGFNTPNREWIWSVYSSEQETIYAYQFFTYEGSNTSSTTWTKRPAAISKELYVQIPATDLRRELFLDPKDDAYTASSSAAGTALVSRARADYGDRLNVASSIFAYMQLKQMAKVMPGVGEMNLFRSSEMYLIEAEADCHLGKEAEARQLLVELNAGSGRNPEYACSMSGDELLNEVRLYNRIELWGEGHDWFNYKRWGLPIVRHSAAQGGSFLATFAGTIEPSANNGWTWVIPNKETDYNTDLPDNME